MSLPSYTARGVQGECVFVPELRGVPASLVERTGDRYEARRHISDNVGTNQRRYGRTGAGLSFAWRTRDRIIEKAVVRRWYRSRP